MSLLGIDREPQRLFIHEGEHQDLTSRGMTGDTGHQAVLVELRSKNISLLYLLDAAAWGKLPIVFHDGESNTNDGYFKQPLSLRRNRHTGKGCQCA